MAVCQMWDVSGRLDHPIDYAVNAEKTAKKILTDDEFQSLRDVMNYTTNDAKTYSDDKEHYVSALNCDIKTARQEMMMTKKEWCDDKKIIAFHGFQSFKPGEVTPHIAHALGIELAEKLWGNRFEVVIATHLNTECIHNHFVINSTSFKSGNRFYDNKESLKNMRSVSDEICKAHGLSVIENPDPYKSHIAIIKEEKAGGETKHTQIRAVIDFAVSNSLTQKDFAKKMNERGYRIRYGDNRKYLTIYPLDGSSPLRSYRLGEDYSKEKIFERIKENRFERNPIPFQPARMYVGYRFVGARTFLVAHKYTGFMALYRHYAYRLGKLPKGTKTNIVAMHPLLREDLRKWNSINKEVAFLHKYKIKTDDELQVFKSSLTDEKQSLIEKRKKLWNSMRGVTEIEKISDIKNEISICSKRTGEITAELKCCDGIINRYPVIKEKLDAIILEENKLQKGKERETYVSIR